MMKTNKATSGVAHDFNKKTKGKTTLFNVDQIPIALQNIPSWILWGFRQINGKLTKVPLNKLHHLTVGTDPAYGYPFKDVCKYVHGGEGLGFILSQNVVCVDVDNCIVDGKYDDIASKLLHEVPTYTEYSQSGTGIHLFYLDENHQFTNRRSSFELFSARKYVSVTGFQIDGLPTELSVLNGKTVELLMKYFPVKRKPINKTEKSTFTESNESILHIANLIGNKKFKRLFYDGNIEGYESHSEADAALLTFLALYTHCNKAQMKELFSMSELGKREKWQEEYYQTYQIDNVVDNIQTDDAKFNAVMLLNKFLLHPETLTSDVYLAAAICKDTPEFMDLWEDFYLFYKDNRKDMSIPLSEFNQQMKTAEKTLKQKQQNHVDEKLKSLANLTLPEPYDSINYITPPGYLLNKDGIYVMTKDGYQLICDSAIYITKMFTDYKSKEQKSQIYLYTEGCGWECLDMVDNTLITNAQKLSLALGKHNIQINSTNSPYLVKYFAKFCKANASTIQHCISTNKLGWVNSKFITPYNQTKYVIDTSVNEFAEHLKVRGNLENWCQIATKVFAHSAITRFILSASFATVLLEPLHARSFTVYLWGNSTSGKSTLFQLAASVWGTSEIVETFGCTLNAFIGKAVNRSSFPFIVDDKQQARENLNINRLIMTLNNGKSDGKMKKDSTLLPTWSWKTIGMFNGEDTLIENNATNGVHTRTLTIHADPLLLPVELSSSVWVDVVDKHCGHAGKLWVDYVNQLNFDELHEQYADLCECLRSNYPEYHPEHLSYVALVGITEKLVAEHIFHTTSDAENMMIKIITGLEKTDMISNSNSVWEHLISWIAKEKAHFKGSNMKAPLLSPCYGEYTGNYISIIKDCVEEEFKRWGNFNISKVLDDLHQSGHLIPYCEKSSNKIRKLWNTTINGCKNIKVIKIKLPTE